ncbi:MAG: hypothetical protein U9R74_00090, partial [Pseudomonadota bacterium]|nr:hypothetical protein [Pseudomonadota bacterium]
MSAVPGPPETDSTPSDDSDPGTGNSIIDPLPRLPELHGEPSLHANPVDVYVVGKSPHTQRMVRSHMNKVAVLFGYESYRNTPWASMRFQHVQELIGVLRRGAYSPATINAVISAVRGTLETAFNLH